MQHSAGSGGGGHAHPAPPPSIIPPGRRLGHSRNGSGSLFQARTLVRTNSSASTDDQLFPNTLSLRGITNTIEALRELVPFSQNGQPLSSVGGVSGQATTTQLSASTTSPQSSLQQSQLQHMLLGQQQQQPIPTSQQQSQLAGVYHHYASAVAGASSHEHTHAGGISHNDRVFQDGQTLRRAAHLRSSVPMVGAHPMSSSTVSAAHGGAAGNSHALVHGGTEGPDDTSVDVDDGGNFGGNPHEFGGGRPGFTVDEDGIETPVGEQEGSGGNSGNAGEEGAGNYPTSRIGLDSFIQWAYRSLPFFLLLLLVFGYRHKLGILINCWLSTVLLHANYTIVKQVGLKDQRSVGRLLLCIVNLIAHTIAFYYIFRSDELYYSLIFNPPPDPIDLWNTLWIICISDTVAKYITMVIKALVVIVLGGSPPFKRTAQYYSLIEHVSQLYRSLLPIPVWYTYLLDDTYGQVFSHLVTGLYLAFKITGVVEKTTQFWFSWRAFVRHELQYGQYATKEQIAEADNTCAICQEDLRDPVALHCKHIFCEDCVGAWLERERTCPLCRATVQMAGKRVWRDGSTSCLVQVF
eukprot:Opistho-2@58490